jgi:hypothetical protein
MAIVVAEPAGNNGFGDGCTARTAHIAFGTINEHALGFGRSEWQATMETADIIGTCRTAIGG